MQDMSTLELGKILSTYFRLTPDQHAKLHFDSYLQSSNDSFNPQVSWNWLQLRFIQDATNLTNLDGTVTDPDPIDFDWQDFIPSITDKSFNEALDLDISGSFLSSIFPVKSLPAGD